MLVLWLPGAFHCRLSHSFKPTGPAVKAGSLPDLKPERKSRLLLPATLFNDNQSVPLSVLVDSGCEQNLISPLLVHQMCITTEPLSVPLRVSALNGETLPKITHRTKPVRLVISGNHTEDLSFFVFPAATTTIVLGYDWLQTHNPTLTGLTLMLNRGPVSVTPPASFQLFLQFSCWENNRR